MTAALNATGQAADLTGDGGMTAGSGTHGQPYSSTAPRGGQDHPGRPAFVLTTDWQEVPPGAEVPPGGEIDMPLDGGPVRARLSRLAWGSPAPNLAELDMAALAAAAAVTLTPNGNGNGNGPHDPAPKFAPLHADKVKDLPPVAWLIKSEIPKHGQTLLWGATGGGKSFLALDYALQLSPTIPIVYVAAEGAAGYAARLLAWQKHNFGRDLGQLYFVDRAVNLLDPNDVDAFIGAIAGLDARLVIFDTLARCMIGGDENSAKDMGLAIENSDRVKRSLGPDGGAVLLVHHGTKAGNTERGSGALKGASDQVIRLDNEDGLLTLTCEKSKDASPFEPRYLRLLPVETGRQNEDKELETSCVVIPADRVIMRGTVTKNGKKLLETLELEAFRDTGGRQAALVKAGGIPEGSFARTVSALIRDGFVTQDAKGEPYRITESGLKKLSELSR